MITENDIQIGSRFKTETGIIWTVDARELDTVSTSMEHGKKGNYRDSVPEVVEFLNEQKSIKL